MVSSALLLGQGCESNPSSAAAEGVGFETIADGYKFAIPDSGTMVISTPEEWRQLWELYWNEFDGSGAKTPPPAMDFNEEVVLGVQYGVRSGCPGPVETIDQITLSEGRLWVVVVGLPDLGPCRSLVHPIHLVKIERHAVPVRFLGIVPE